jgi:peptidyl-prolyl cis-trans isomerase C
MINKSIYLALCCSTLFVVGCNQAADNAPTVPKAAETATTDSASDQSATPMDQDTLLMVNGQPVTKNMYGLYFQDRMRAVPNAQNNPQMQMSVLNELSNIIIVAQAAEKQGIGNRPEIVATLDLLKAKLLTQTSIQEYAEKHKPNEDQIKTLYEADYAGKTGMEYKARHILVKEEAEAKDLISQLDKGADFAELAKKHSTGPTGKNGGDLGWFDAEQMVKPFSDAVVDMEKGAYTKTPVKTQFGWHVILLEDSRKTEAPSLESVRGDIITKLQQQSLAEYMQGLRNESKIVFNETNAVKAQPAEAEASGQEATAATDEAKPAETTTPAETSAPAEEPKAAEESKPATE